jgi:catechol 2,3-dioxygenase-like lactoylglutathione lyase family enzyme
MTIRPTIDHVTLRVSDLAASRRFYEAAMSPLGLGLAFGGGRVGG